MKRLPRGPIRWPGGCFADSYDWRDGVGPRDARPRRTNFWAGTPGQPDGPGKYDPNHFGTNEFVRFCRLAGGEPYLAANLRSLPARDFYQWVEYCNSPAGSTTLAELRAQDGDRDPFKVATGASATRAGAAAATSRPRSTPPSIRRFTAWVPGYGVDAGVHRVGPEQRRPELDARLPARR